MPEPFAESYLRLCKRQGKAIVSKLAARPGDWLLGPGGLRLAGDPPEQAAGELVVPDLERLLHLLRAEAPVVLLDTQNDDFGVCVYDEANRALANVVSLNAPEACLRALLFIRSERAAQGLKLTPIG